MPTHSNPRYSLHIPSQENMQTLLLNFFNKVNDDKKNTGNNDFYIAVPTDVTEVPKLKITIPSGLKSLVLRMLTKSVRTCGIL